MLDIVASSADLLPVLVVGAPLRHRHRIYNTAVVIHRGAVLGVAPKSYLPTYREFYERRQIAPGDDERGTIRICDADGPVRPRPAVRRVGHARLRAARRDLRGHVRADSAQRGSGAGRRDGAGQPVRQPDHRSAAPRTAACWPARRRRGAWPPTSTPPRGGRIDHRPGLGRPDHDLGERRAAGRIRALSQRGATLRSPTSTSICCARSGCGWGRSTTTGATTVRSAESFRRIEFRLDPPARRHRTAPRHRAFPVRPREPRTAGTGLLRGLQHPGIRARAAAACAELPEGRHRDLRRPGLDPRADRRGTRDGP